MCLCVVSEDAELVTEWWQVHIADLVPVAVDEWSSLNYPYGGLTAIRAVSMSVSGKPGEDKVEHKLQV